MLAEVGIQPVGQLLVVELDRRQLSAIRSPLSGLDITIEKSVRRTTARHRAGQDNYRQGRDHGGRYIPPEAIRALAAAPHPG